MLNFCGIVVAILKMATGRNFPMSGINSGHHNLPIYEILLKSDNVEFVRYCGVHFENGDRPPQYRKKVSSEFVTMQCSFKLLSVTGLGDFIIIRL
jgi:hypothetical protein